MKSKIECWNGYEIRFVEVNGEWWAVLADIARALGLQPKYMKERLDDEVGSTDLVKDSLGRRTKMLIVSEFGIYEAVFSSRKKEAKEFKRWVYSIIKKLRESSGLEGFQVFQMLDKEHQKKAMNELNRAFGGQAETVDYIKANTIANKAVANIYGYPKLVKKSEMSPGMLKQRQGVLSDTVELMSVKEKYGLNIKVSEEIYKKRRCISWI